MAALSSKPLSEVEIEQDQLVDAEGRYRIGYSHGFNEAIRVVENSKSLKEALGFLYRLEDKIYKWRMRIFEMKDKRQEVSKSPPKLLD